MRTHIPGTRHLLSLIFVLLLAHLAAQNARAHCDALDGPVVRDARTALEQRDLAPVLKWILPEDEAEVRRAFELALVVREKGPESRELADLHFFGTVVRLHRASEGEPYTGLKPAGTDPGPAVSGADEALREGDASSLVRLVTDEVDRGLRERFEHAHQALGHSGESVEAGRAYVAAYVEFVHYAKRLLEDASHDATHGIGTAPAGH